MPHKLATGKYKFATVRENNENYASGRVFYGAPGATGFPVRLASEIFQRCEARLIRKGVQPPYTVYDPYCGSGYSVAIIGFLHGTRINRIYASDISPEALELTQRNLSLLHPAGLNKRITEIQDLIQKFNKQSHLDALESSLRLKSHLESRSSMIQTKCFRFDILGDEDLSLQIQKVDLVLTDLPYGQVASWSGSRTDTAPAQKLLTNIRHVLNPNAFVAITTSKKPAISYDGYRRVEHLIIGKRRLLILEPTGLEGL